MRAIIIREPGGPEVLAFAERPDITPQLHHVRVAVRYAGVNRADLLQRMGLYPPPPGTVVDVPGLEYAGVVDAIGEGVTRVAVGDRVFGLVAGGAYAQQIVAHEREVVKTPTTMRDRDAASIPEAFVTAYDALVVRGRLRPGERVLISAAGSGVGTAAVQIARALGCTVIGTSRTEEKLERARGLGLDVAICTKNGQFADRVLEVTSNEGVDVVCELVGGAYVTEDLRAIAKRGRIVVVGLTGGPMAEVNLGMLLHRRGEIVGTSLRSRPLEEKIEVALLLEKTLVPWFSRGLVRPIVDRVFAAEKAADSHSYVASDVSFGKVLLDFT